jgi:hypothetical protein
MQNRGGRKGNAKDAMIFALVFCILCVLRVFFVANLAPARMTRSDGVKCI